MFLADLGYFIAGVIVGVIGDIAEMWWMSKKIEKEIHETEAYVKKIMAHFGIRE
jgi:hypothetical protein